MSVDHWNTVIENEELKSKYMLLQHEWRCQQNTIGRLEIQMTKLRSQLKYQAQFCSKTGSALGYILWKTTKIPEVLDIILQEKNISELSQIMIDVLVSFNDTYHTKTPIADTEETRFILNIVGLVANLTTVDAGQRFFSVNNSGKNVIQLMVRMVPRILSPSGNQLKKILYVALHNVNIYSTGSSQIINAELINVLNDDIVDINNANVEPDLRLFALKLLQSLIRGVCTKTAYDILNDNIQKARLISLSSTVDAETETMARSILDDFKTAKKHFDNFITMT